MTESTWSHACGTRTHVHARLFLTAQSTFQKLVMFACRKLTYQTHSGEAHRPQQCDSGVSRCENHMVVGGWSCWEYLMFVSWHELKWWELRNSICLYVLTVSGEESWRRFSFPHQGVCSVWHCENERDWQKLSQEEDKRTNLVHFIILNRLWLLYLLYLQTELCRNNNRIKEVDQMPF